MTSNDIRKNIEVLFESDISEIRDDFIYDFLIAFGISKTSVTRLKKGDFNLSKNKGELLYKSKIFFKEESEDKLLSTVDGINNDKQILRHKPRFAIATDYKHLVALDLRTQKTLDIQFSELPKRYDFFLPLAGSEIYNASNNNEADRNASYKMAELYDRLREENPEVYNSQESIHQLNIFLSRLLFCFFAEDTEIFAEESVFTNSLVQHTNDNGEDTHIFLETLFKRLNTKKTGGLPSYLAEQFPFVNGSLFNETIAIPRFTAKARKVLIALGDLDWKNINPDIFGSMIQAVVLPEYRSDLGMHYTSVENILKLIKPLFLDELYEEYEKAQDNANKLKKLQYRISKMKFFDPACGSGNFLIITYKEIRRLEIIILKRITELNSLLMFVESEITLQQFYGIEIDDFAHEMAILSLWLAEHQMNQYFEIQLAEFSEPKSIIPLKKSGSIICANATRYKWEDACSITKEDETYIIGNPPYLGYSRQDAEQKSDMAIVFNGIRNYKKLDYIACWFYKASLYIEDSKTKYAFVTTNSITQGEQVALLWPLIINKEQEINFAYQSFKWTNNAKGNAGVAVVIIGIRNNCNESKYIYNEGIKQNAKNISPYISNTNNVFITQRKYTLSDFPKMRKGSSPGDNGNLLLDEAEKNELITNNLEAKRYIKNYIGAQEFIKGHKRYCIHIEAGDEDDANKISSFRQRFEKVRDFRLKSKKVATQKKATTPYFFDEDKYQAGEFILVPQTGSERRKYLPVGFFDNSYIPSNATRVLYNFEPFHFGVISSQMHIIWVRTVAGRLKTDMQYSNTLCYNTFPFPKISKAKKEVLNMHVFDILDERAKFPEKTMAWLYNPDTMPVGLLKAHQELDAAIERCYRPHLPFKNDTERLEYLFKLYEKMVNENKNIKK